MLDFAVIPTPPPQPVLCCDPKRKVSGGRNHERKSRNRKTSNPLLTVLEETQPAMAPVRFVLTKPLDVLGTFPSARHIAIAFLIKPPLASLIKICRDVARFRFGYPRHRHCGLRIELLGIDDPPDEMIGRVLYDSSDLKPIRYAG
jgi:hypothetical protein